MLNFFSSPDLSKFRGKNKKCEPAVKLKHVMWNSELRLQSNTPLAPYKGRQYPEMTEQSLVNFTEMLLVHCSLLLFN